MNRRCYDPKDVCYKNYGERGITVCKEWRESFWNFAEWAMSAGYVEGLTLERIDVDKGYSPENCTFIPWRQQYHNRTDTRWVVIFGERLCLRQAWEKYGAAPWSAVKARFHQKTWDDVAAITTPSAKKRG